MGDTIIKASKDEDFYAVFSSIVDGITGYGTRAELEAEYPHAAAPRFDRADATGSSCRWVRPPEFGWDDTEMMIREDDAEPVGALYGVLQRCDLRRYCEQLDSAGREQLLRWVYDYE